MKPSFHTRVLNGPFGDPGLYVRVLREGRALMFDTGYTTALSTRDVLKTTHIFVSHTHMDHFMGFDTVMRICLKREQPLSLFGPHGFTDCIEGKLKGYTWNLIREYPLVINVSEISEQGIRGSVFKAENSFRREETAFGPFVNEIYRDSTVTVQTAILNHQIPCLAFSLEENDHINIDKVKLDRLNLPVGPWLNDLKDAIRRNSIDRVFDIDGRRYTFSDVRGVAEITRGQKLSYVVDAAGSEENIRKITDLVKGSDTLYIESYFSHEDRERAKTRFHLTARDAGRIAREAEAGRIEAIHFSPKYMHEPEMLIREVKEEFER